MTTWGHENAYDRRRADPHRVAQRYEASRRQIVILVMTVFWMIVLEGAVRKWLFPEFHRVILFARDPVLLAAYVLALKDGYLRPNAPLFLFAMVTLLGAPILLSLQILTSPYEFNPVLAGYGWRNYVLYAPLIHVIAETFRKEDLDRVFRHVLFLAVLSAPLMAAQVQADPFDPINIGTGNTDEETFANLGLALGIARATGFFTSSNGSYIFSVTAFAIALGLWLRAPRDRNCRMPLLAAGTVAAVVCVFLSGNRGSIVHVGIILLCGYLASAFLVTQHKRMRMTLSPLLLLALAGSVLPLFFPAVYDAFVYRFISAQADEEQVYAFGLFGRALRQFTTFIPALSDTPVFGYGLGYGTNAAVLLNLLPLYLQPEDDWHRHVVDLGPALGLVIIIGRIVLVAWLGAATIAAIRKGNDPMPLALFGLVALPLLAGQITGHSTLNGFTWLFAGALWAMTRRHVGKGRR